MVIAQLGPVLMFTAGVALLTVILLRRTYRQLGRRRKFDSRPIALQPRPTNSWDGARGDAAAVIERQKVELAELQRDVGAQLDSKILALRELLARSQQQVAQLEALLDEAAKRPVDSEPPVAAD